MNISEITHKYLHLLYEKKGDTPISLEDYEKFLKTAVKFGKDGSVISENSGDLIDVPDEAIKLLLGNCHSKIGGDWIKHSLRGSRHWRNIKNATIGSVYFDMFDFSDIKEIDRFNYSCFSIEGDALVEARSLFMQSTSESFGFYNSYDDFHVICANSNADDIYQVVHHELSHFIQHAGGVRIVNDLKLADIKRLNILESEFGESYQKVIRYFSGAEFVPHVDDMRADLKRLRESYYAADTGAQFKNRVYEFLRARSREDVSSSKLFNDFWLMKKGNVASLMMLLFARISGYRFQKIMDFIRSVFE